MARLVIHLIPEWAFNIQSGAYYDVLDANETEWCEDKVYVFIPACNTNFVIIKTKPTFDRLVTFLHHQRKSSFNQIAPFINNKK